MDFGAKGDHQTRDDHAIQKAIDACHQSGGGTVLLPSGDYLAGTIQLKSNVTLHIDSGATLWASVEREDYDASSCKSLILGENLDNISITGRGKINGQGISDERPDFRPCMIYLLECKNILIEGITIEYASQWTIHLFRCDTANIRGVTILNNINRLNTDGIDPHCSKNVHISDCHIVAGDDCIVLKATEEYPCENITVTNCTLETTCAALKLGTETHGDIKHCTFSNCVIRNTRHGIAFYMKDGGTMDSIIFSNITIETYADDKRKRSGEWPIFMNLEKRHPTSKVGRIRNVTFSNIFIHTRGRCFVEGMQEMPIENLTFDNITIMVEDFEDVTTIRKPRGGRASKKTATTEYDAIPAHLIFAHIRGLTLRHVKIQLDTAEPLQERSALYGDCLESVYIDSELAAIELNQCKDVLFTKRLSR